MYDYIKGEISELTPTSVVVEAAGVGYMLNISLNTYSDLDGKSESKVYVSLIVREDAHILYGFSTKSERTAFLSLTSVNGVGANTARTILSSFSANELVSIVQKEDYQSIKTVKGIGLKTAQKIVIELKDKLKPSEDSKTVSNTGTVSNKIVEESVTALTMLGYDKKTAEKAVQSVVTMQPNASVEVVIKSALKLL